MEPQNVHTCISTIVSIEERYTEGTIFMKFPVSGSLFVLKYYTIDWSLQLLCKCNKTRTSRVW